MTALAILGGFWAVAAQAVPSRVQADTEQGMLCRQAIQQAENGARLPAHLLSGIARVESGRPDPLTGRIHPWPWTINAEGQGSFFATKTEAVNYTRQLQARGVQSIDVGCMQVNLMHHPDAFNSLEEAFDPAANASYAVRFLSQLRDKAESWEVASGWYHSANPQEGNPYRGKVIAAMIEEAKGLTWDGAVPSIGSGASPLLASSLRGMLAGHGNVILLPRHTGGTILAQANPILANSGPVTPVSLSAGLGGPAATLTSPMAQAGMTSAIGRGLDAYRRTPVAMVLTKMLTAR